MLHHTTLHRADNNSTPPHYPSVSYHTILLVALVDTTLIAPCNGQGALVPDGPFEYSNGEPWTQQLTTTAVLELVQHFPGAYTSLVLRALGTRVVHTIVLITDCAPRVSYTLHDMVLDTGCQA